MYLHDVITEKATLSFNTEPTTKNSEGIRDKGHLYITSILQKALKVNINGRNSKVSEENSINLANLNEITSTNAVENDYSDLQIEAKPRKKAQEQKHGVGNERKSIAMSMDNVRHMVDEKSILLHSLYMDSAEYQKKKYAKTLLMQNAPAYTPEVQVSQTSNNSIPENSENVNRNYKAVAIYFQ